MPNSRSPSYNAAVELGLVGTPNMFDMYPLLDTGQRHMHWIIKSTNINEVNWLIVLFYTRSQREWCKAQEKSLQYKVSNAFNGSNVWLMHEQLYTQFLLVNP
jgi:hypothetical protein